MNNSQFRKLLVDTPARQHDANSNKNGGSATPRAGGATPALGSRMRSSIPMTPRSVGLSHGGNEFARQLAERNATHPQEQRKFKTQKVRGSRLAEGYTDRTQLRTDVEDDDKAKRIKELENLVKLQQITQEDFEKMRNEIIGDDVQAAHLVKGLDRRLLERARRGEVGVEDVINGTSKPSKDDKEDDEVEDVEDEFDELEDRQVTAKEREATKKKGEMAASGLVPGQKRTRDMILAEMKAARLAAKEAAKPSLGDRFRKVGAPRIESRIERDGKGREVLITIDENGKEKRKVRKVVEETEPVKLDMPNKNVAPLGMEVPTVREATPEDDVDIFDDVGDEYDPLAGLDEEDSEDEVDKEDGEVEQTEKQAPPMSSNKSQADTLAMPPPPIPMLKPSAPRNYFNEKPSAEPKQSSGSLAMSDPTILAALKRASQIAPLEGERSAEEKAREEKRKRMLQQDDRDAEDMDLGFGGSRFEDQADLDDDGTMKLSDWGKDDDGEGDGKGAKGPRKRGPKKRKGDKNSAADVLGAMERQRAAK